MVMMIRLPIQMKEAIERMADRSGVTCNECAVRLLAQALEAPMP